MVLKELFWVLCIKTCYLRKLFYFASLWLNEYPFKIFPSLILATKRKFCPYCWNRTYNLASLWVVFCKIANKSNKFTGASRLGAHFLPQAYKMSQLCIAIPSHFYKRWLSNLAILLIWNCSFRPWRKIFASLTYIGLKLKRISWVSQLSDASSCSIECLDCLEARLDILSWSTHEISLKKWEIHNNQ